LLSVTLLLPLRVNSKELIKKLEKDGWYQVRQNGSHKIFKHDHKKSISGMPISVPDHGKKDLGEGLASSIMKEAGLK